MPLDGDTSTAIVRVRWSTSVQNLCYRKLSMLEEFWRKHFVLHKFGYQLRSSKLWKELPMPSHKTCCLKRCAGVCGFPLGVHCIFLNPCRMQNTTQFFSKISFIFSHQLEKSAFLSMWTGSSILKAFPEIHAFMWLLSMSNIWRRSQIDFDLTYSEIGTVVTMLT